jgi:hypothetical protein
MELLLDPALDVVAALQLLDELKEGLLRGQLAPVFRFALFYIIRRISPPMEALLIDLNCSKALVQGIDEVSFDGVLLYL